MARYGLSKNTETPSMDWSLSCIERKFCAVSARRVSTMQTRYCISMLRSFPSSSAGSTEDNRKIQENA